MIDWSKKKTAADREEEVAAARKDVEQAEAAQYLRDTDWYAARLAETGEPIPKDVSNKRAEARKHLDGMSKK